MKQLVMERIARLCIKQGVSQIGFGCPWKSGISTTINIFTTNTTKLFFFLIKVNNENTPTVWEICSSVNKDTF